MSGIKELKQEVARLKRRLEDEEEQLSKSNKKLKAKETELDLMKLKVTKQDELLRQVCDKIECPVCMEMPRSGPVPVCPNGHFVCKTHKADSCPTCRTAMGDGKSLLATTILEKSEHNCKFANCDQKFLLADIEKHEEVCLFRTVNCLLHQKCNEKVSLSNLPDHLSKSKECAVGGKIIPLSENWTTQMFSINQEIQTSPKISWMVRLYSFSGEVFAVFPNKCGGQFYFQVVMLATQNQCSKFRFEMVVHEEGTTVSDTKMNAKFGGEPLSIDLKKTDFNLFGTNEKLIAKLLEKSKNKDQFDMSFRILNV